MKLTSGIPGPICRRSLSLQGSHFNMDGSPNLDAQAARMDSAPDIRQSLQSYTLDNGLVVESPIPQGAPQKSHWPDWRGKYWCKVCLHAKVTTKFLTNEELQDHKKTVHGTVNKKAGYHPCKYCEEEGEVISYRHSGALVKHIKTDHPEDWPKYHDEQLSKGVVDPMNGNIQLMLQHIRWEKRGKSVMSRFWIYDVTVIYKLT